MFLCATMVLDAAGEVGLTGGTPVLHVCVLLSAEKTDYSLLFKLFLKMSRQEVWHIKRKRCIIIVCLR